MTIKTAFLCLTLGMSSFVFAAPQTHQITVEAGRASGVNRQWIQNLAYECGVAISVETESNFLDKVYYVTYKGEHKNALCFWEGIQRAGSRSRY